PKSHFPGPNTGIVFGLFLCGEYDAVRGKTLRVACCILPKPYHTPPLDRPGFFAAIVKFL
ncbi:hypothetical protein, partial [Citrobacter sp.]|uniref:hypothetical protein n=1 Tax=Citrobacter sp. TaxID=1896336 RepID=UPI002FCA9623